ncbi:hypothetical protein M231_05117 [Tremella mesenterica]|uniref:Uncharacterized protein n=1 Tax=Tremella mesenterica TaxID=5217 RepID=A0A4Q1BIW8_TREME|nr:hypothetical protein M231_05117 [Tremella mesenterica]
MAQGILQSLPSETKDSTATSVADDAVRCEMNHDVVETGGKNKDEIVKRTNDEERDEINERDKREKVEMKENGKVGRINPTFLSTQAPGVPIRDVGEKKDDKITLSESQREEMRMERERDNEVTWLDKVKTWFYVPKNLEGKLE